MKLRIAQTLVVLIVTVLVFVTPAAAQSSQYKPYQPKPNPLAGPMKAEKDAHAAVDKARAQLIVIRKKIAVSWEVKPDWKAAKDAFEQGKVAYDAASKKLIATLETNPEYKALEVKRDKAQAILDQSGIKAAPSADDTVKLTEEDILNAGRERTESALAMKKFEKEAEDNDPGIIAAKQKFEESRVAWDAMQKQLDDAVAADPDYKPTMDAIAQAETQWKSARDALATAAKAQRASSVVHH